MKAIRRKLLPTITAAALSLAVSGAHAAQGDWLLRFGAANVDPSAGSTGVVPDDAIDVDDGTAAFINGTYMIRDNIGIELLAATPFSHDIILEGVGKIAETDHLPPTLSLQYHFSPASNVRPYVGAGLNWTTFFDEEAIAVINDISLDDSFGWAVQAGVDVEINEKWFLNADIRKIDIETTAETDIGNIEVEIDPVVISLGIGLRF